MENAPVCYPLLPGVSRNVTHATHGGFGKTFKKYCSPDKTRLIMHLTVILLLALGGQVTAKTVSQTITLTGAGLSVRQVFEAVKKQTRYTIFYDKDILTIACPVSIMARNMPLNDFLGAALKDQPFDFYLGYQAIFIRKKILEPEKINGSTSEKTLSPISGVVLGPEGSPLVGVKN